MTCLFYAALHYVDAYLHHSGALPGGVHRRSHGTRLQLAQSALGVPLTADFAILRAESEEARYNAGLFTLASVEALYDDEFARIRTHVRAALNL